MDGKQGSDVALDAALGVAARESDRSLASAMTAADSAVVIDWLRQLEDLKSAAAALQARLSVAFDLAQRREQASAGMRKSVV